MKTLEDINLDTWFVDRELDAAPEHFIRVNTVVTSESKEWILEKLRGRFYISRNMFSSSGGNLAFEDPKEAVFYELTWG